MIVKNPTDNEISVVISGTKYVVPAKGELSGVSEAHAMNWKIKTHEFIELKDELDAEVTTTTTDETGTEIGEEVVGDDTEETVDLGSLKRADLDKLAQSLEIDPSEFKKIDDLREAVAEKLTN